MMYQKLNQHNVILVKQKFGLDMLRTGFSILIYILVLLNTVWAQSAFSSHELFPLYKQYQGEDQSLSKRDKVVQYFNDNERQLHRAYVKDGKLVDHKGVLLDPDLNKFPQRAGTAIYVMDSQGMIYYSFDHRYGSIHHSSFLAGKAVASAGEMLIYQGMVYSISNKSGHYRPSAIAINRLIQRLTQMKVILVGIDLFLVNSKGKLQSITHHELSHKVTQIQFRLNQIATHKY